MFPFGNRNRLKISQLAMGGPNIFERAKQGMEGAMANARYERARARARLALIAPAVDDASAAYFDGLVDKVLLEAKLRGEKSDQELISTVLDAVARRYFTLSLLEREQRRISQAHGDGDGPSNR